MRHRASRKGGNPAAVATGRSPPAVGAGRRHTVGYHLHKIYAKLGIASRADLRQLDLDGDAG